MADKEIRTATPRSAAINFSRPLPSPSLPSPTANIRPSDSSAHLPLSASAAVNTEEHLPGMAINGSLADAESANPSAQLARSLFTRDEAAKGNGTTHISTAQTSPLPSPSLATTTAPEEDNSSSSCNTPRSTSVCTMAETTAQLGTSKPIMNFRPHLWKHLDTESKSLMLDLFWPVKTGDEDDGVFVNVPKDEDGHIIVEKQGLPLDDFKPILAFRNLQVLQLTGMMLSYQPVLWQVVWSNPKLAILQLEMAVAPMFNVDSKHPNRLIDHKWSCFPTMDATSSTLSVNNQASDDLAASEEIEEAYLGCEGTGVLDEKFGDGEYLDKVAIRNAQIGAANAHTLPITSLRYLPIRRLTLQNFVIDGIAIQRWFDPAKLRQIVFKSGCIDAGFYLSPDMKRVALKTPPGPASLPETAMVADPDSINAILRRAPAVPGLKLVELKKGKVVSSTDVIKGKAALTPESAKTAPATKSSPLTRVKTVIRGLGRGKDAKAVAPPAPAAAPAAAPTVADAASLANSSESFLHVERPLEDTAGATVLPPRSLGGCFGGDFTNAEVKEAKKGKKKA